MELTNTNTLILIIAGLAVVFILFKIAQKIIKFVLLAVIIGLAIFFWQGGTVSDLKGAGVNSLFGDSNMQTMMDDHCAGEKAERVKCSCIIEPVYQDLSNRLSASEIAEANRNPDRMEAELHKSVSALQKEISLCLTKEKGTDYLKKLNGLWDKLKDAANENTSP